VTAPSILSMHRTVDDLERMQDERDAALPARTERSHYWHVERKTKRGWKFHAPFYGTKREVARFWSKHFIGNKEFRLRHVLAY
jgi:hypothetical protein